jgi:ABC-2 type transport system ATP-binding protein
MAYVPDDPKLFDALTIWEHLEFVASAYEVEDFVPKGERLLAEFDLVEKRDTIAQELSRGMRQKTAVCCACLHDPAVMMFDEPIVGLDPRAIRTLKDGIVERARRGAAIVISSHMLPLVEDLCTHLIVLYRGEALYFGSVADAHTAYAVEGAKKTLEEVFFALTEGRDVPGEAR